MRFTRALGVLAFALLAVPVSAAWTRVGTFAVGNSVTNSTTLVVATSAALEAGNVGVCVIGYDEGGAGTTDGEVGRISSVADAGAANTWEYGREFCNMNTVGTADGACVAIWYVRARTQINSATNITVTFPASIVAKALTCEEFTVAAGASTRVTLGGNGLANDAADPGSMTVATTENVPHLFLRGTACESMTLTFTVDTDFVVFGGSTTTSTANTAVEATSMGARGDSRIATEATSLANDPTYVAADCASVMIALDEIPCQYVSQFGVGCR